MDGFALHGEARDLLALWYEARGAQALPSRYFIDPLKLRRWIGDLSIIHLHDGPKRLYVSLHGANVARHLGPDFHKKYLEDAVPGNAIEDNAAPYDVSIETRLPCYSIQRQSLHRGLIVKSLERMVMPCSNDDPEKADRFLVWAAPITTNDRTSSSVYVPFDKIDMIRTGQNTPDRSTDLFSLSTDWLG